MGCSRLVAVAASLLCLLLGACDSEEEDCDSEAESQKPELSIAAFPAQVDPGGVTLVAVEVHGKQSDWPLCLTIPGEGEDALLSLEGGAGDRQWKLSASGSKTVSVLYRAEKATGDRVVAAGLHDGADQDCSLAADKLVTVTIVVSDKPVASENREGVDARGSSPEAPAGPPGGSSGGSDAGTSTDPGANPEEPAENPPGGGEG